MTVMLRSASVWSGFSGAPGYTNLYWRPGTGGGSVADASDISARVRAFWLALAPVLPTSVKLDVNPTCEAIEDTTGQLVGAFTGSTPAQVVGSGGANYAPRTAAWCMRAKTNLVVGGRFLQGRFFLTPLYQNAFASADGTPFGFATAQTAANAMLTGGGTASFPVTWGRPVDTPFRAGTSGPIVSYAVLPFASVLRSRRD